MAKPNVIELPDGTPVPVVYEDRSVLVLDKPAGWLVAPDDWIQTSRNLFLALREGIDFGDWWARSRNLRFLRFVHRLDAETSGLLLCVKNAGAMAAYSKLFADHSLDKTYLAVVEGAPALSNWTRRDPIGPDDRERGRFQVDERAGKESETVFRVLARSPGRTLVEARPRTGRTHQIRLHLVASGCPVVGDELYGRSEARGLALRAVALSYGDPFTSRRIRIFAPTEDFCRGFGFAAPPRERSAAEGKDALAPKSVPSRTPDRAGPAKSTTRDATSQSSKRLSRNDAEEK